MSYLRTEKEINGDYFTNINYYSCDITKEEICESDGWYGNSLIHISNKGMEILIEDWINRNSNKCGIPIILKYIENRLTTKIRPDRFIPYYLKKKVLLKYKHKCRLCGSTDKLEFDHIKPVSKGGISELSNLQILCKNCNLKKSNKE